MNVFLCKYINLYKLQFFCELQQKTKTQENKVKEMQNFAVRLQKGETQEKKKLKNC